MRRLAATIALVAVMLMASPASAHMCGHPSALTQVGTSGTYYKAPSFKDTGTTHWAAAYNCGSSGCVFTYYHGHTPYTSCHTYWWPNLTR